MSMQQWFDKSKSGAHFCDMCSRILDSPRPMRHNEAMNDSKPLGVRARARAELLADVGRVARSQLAEVGAADLSVRAIARELGLASSALYRYYPSRDALLTQLIIESYDSLGEHVERAEDAIDPADLAGRYAAICHAVRSWALDHRHEYALIYGSPVPGYAAPADTIDPATRVTRRFVALISGAKPTRSTRQLAAPLTEQLDHVAQLAGHDVDLNLLAIGVGLWAQIYGMVSFELFGTFTNIFDDADAIFDHQVQLGIAALGLD